MPGHSLLDESATVSVGGRRSFLRAALGAGASLVRALSPFGGSALSKQSPAAVAKKEGANKLNPPLRWRPHDVAKIPSGYQVAVADVNGDGQPDILALSSEASIVEWYKNPTWAAHPITTRTCKNISLAPLLWRGCWFEGIALAADFHLEDSTQGSVWWAKPYSDAGHAGQEWELCPIAQIPTSHRLRWADLDGDGRPELVDVPLLGPGAKAPDYRGGAPITWFEMPEAVFHHAPSQDDRERWKAHLIDDSLSVVHGILVFDWDQDGRDELLTASFEGIHFFRSTGRGADLRWKKVRLAEGDRNWKPASGAAPAEVHRGSSEIGVGEVATGRRFLATIEPWHGDQVVVYFPAEHARADQLWDRHVIDSSFRDGHALACADFDGDGNDEIVAGYRGPGTSLCLYHTVDDSGTKWERQTLDTEMAASGVAIADINSDGRLDVVAIGASTGNVKWYENLG